MNRPMLATAQQLEQSCFFPFNSTLKQNIHQNVAMIPVEGLLMHRFSGYGSSYDAIRLGVQQALEDDAVNHIVLDINSGGGEVSGLFDLVEFIVKARKQKPITALVDEHAYSAAYLIASSATEIIAPKTAGVGSIGVIVGHLDQSEAEKKIGIKVTEVYAGKHKVDFSPHKPLSEQAENTLQTQVDEIYQLLLETLARNRGMNIDVFRNTEAKTYSSSQALDLKLIDSIQSPFQFLEELQMTEGNKKPTDTSDETNIVAAERERAKAIMQMCKLAKMTDCAESMIEEGLTVEKAREVLFEKLAANVGDIHNAISPKQDNGKEIIHAMVQGLGGKTNARL